MWMGKKNQLLVFPSKYNGDLAPPSDHILSCPVKRLPTPAIAFKNNQFLRASQAATHRGLWARVRWALCNYGSCPFSLPHPGHVTPTPSGYDQQRSKDECDCRPVEWTSQQQFSSISDWIWNSHSAPWRLLPPVSKPTGFLWVPSFRMPFILPCSTHEMYKRFQPCKRSEWNPPQVPDSWSYL